MVLELLSIKDLLAMSRTSRGMLDVVKQYHKRAFNLQKTLAPFLPSESIESFREMLRATGGIISGSVALQFLDRASFSSSDLDVYVRGDMHLDAEDWLLSHGLTRITGEVNVNDEIDVAEDYNFLQSQIDSVDNFRSPISSRIIQLISTKKSPILAVLHFHSCTSSNLTRNPSSEITG